jgi:hypothetical protein
VGVETPSKDSPVCTRTDLLGENTPDLLLVCERCEAALSFIVALGKFGQALSVAAPVLVGLVRSFVRSAAD